MLLLPTAVVLAYEVGDKVVVVREANLKAGKTVVALIINENDKAECRSRLELDRQGKPYREERKLRPTSS
jgi:hypothetical protein